MKVMIGSLKSKYRAEVLFDDEDTMLLFNFRWHVSAINKRTQYAAARAQDSNKIIYMHQLILPARAKLVTDHINLNGLDNRRCNLRYANFAENLRNRPPNKGRKYKGVSFTIRGKILRKPWAARLNTKYKSIHLGYFATEIEAALAYNEAALKYFKDFAYLNKI